MIPLLLFAAVTMQQIGRITATFDGVAGVTAINLENGRRVAFNGTQQFPMASVYKLTIGMAILQRVDRRELSLTDEVTIPPEEFHAGHSPLIDEAKGKPITMTVGRLLERIVGESDNSASDYALAHIVPAAEVRKMLKTLGVQNVDVSRPEAMIIGQILNEGDKIETPASYDARNKSISMGERTEGMRKFWLDRRDTGTPNGLADLLVKLYQHKAGLSAESEEIVMRIMRETKTGPDRIKGGVPKEAGVAHKTGTMPGTLNDIGIITSPDGKHHIAIAVMTKWSRGEDAQRAKIVAEITKAVYDDLTQ